MSHFQLPLDIKSLEIISQNVDSKGNITFEVKSKEKGTHCHKCGKWTEKVHGFGETLTVCHVSILDKPVYLKIRVVRYQCEIIQRRQNATIGWNANQRPQRLWTRILIGN